MRVDSPSVCRVHDSGFNAFNGVGITLLSIFLLFFVGITPLSLLVIFFVRITSLSRDKVATC